VALFGGVSFTLYPLALAHAGDRLTKSEDMVGLSSGMLLLYSAGAAVGPLVAGMIFSPFDGGGLFLMIAGVAAISVGFGLFRMQQVSPSPSEDLVAFVAIPRTSPAGAELDPRQEDSSPDIPETADSPT
jgi:MFS family permease